MGLATVALGDRSGFPDLRPKAYCNHAAISPPSVWVHRAVESMLHIYAVEGLGAFPSFLQQRERLRAQLAELIGAAARDIALTVNTTAGIMAIALCFPWQEGDRVLTFEGEFPTNVTPWQRAAETFGLREIRLPLNDYLRDDGSAGLQKLEETLREGVRLVAVSSVQFQTGLRMPVEAMADLCHRHGAELFVDAIQSVGGLPMDVQATGIDYLACGSHKWLMGLEGAGFLYVAPHRIKALKPRIAGWLSHQDGLKFLFEGPGHLRYDRPIREDASFLETGAPNAAGYVALEASMGPIRSLGVRAIAAHGSRYLDQLEDGLLDRGFRSLRTPDPARRSLILGVHPPEDVDLRTLHAHLIDHGIAVTIPDGILRFAPHWPNHPHEVPKILAAIDSVPEQS